jgi:hypothetical protein
MLAKRDEAGTKRLFYPSPPHGSRAKRGAPAFAGTLRTVFLGSEAA